jgi:transaldolase
MNRLIRLYEEFDQSPWLDNLRRGYLTSGQLVAFRDQGIRGLTSNPTIFQKAIEGASDYDEQFRVLALDEHPTVADYWTMVLQDIAGAADVFEPTYAESGGSDGFVSIEVDPGLAHDGPATEEAARALHERIARRNVMVKIPATAEGIGPIRTMISEGRNTNVTLIFSLDRYREVIDAYLDGLEVYATQDGTELGTVASVASFFISRVDTEVDRRLEQIGSAEALALRGKAAIAQGKLAYRLFAEAFAGERWEALAARGAKVQRPLWASTSTKNPAYADTMYVDNLIGPFTVNTMPDATIEAFLDHGTLERTVDRGVDEAQAVWDDLARVGIDLDDVAAQLEREGVATFQKSFQSLIEALDVKVAELRAAG